MLEDLEAQRQQNEIRQFYRKQHKEMFQTKNWYVLRRR